MSFPCEVFNTWMGIQRDLDFFSAFSTWLIFTGEGNLASSEVPLLKIWHQDFGNHLFSIFVFFCFFGFLYFGDFWSIGEGVALAGGMSRLPASKAKVVLNASFTHETITQYLKVWILHVAKCVIVSCVILSMWTVSMSMTSGSWVFLVWFFAW